MLNYTVLTDLYGGCGADYPYDNGIDATCAGNMQGYCRMERTVAYARYVQEYFMRKYGFEASGHRLALVDGFGHDPCGMIQSTTIRTAIAEFLQGHSLRRSDDDTPDRSDDMPGRSDDTPHPPDGHNGR